MAGRAAIRLNQFPRVASRLDEPNTRVASLPFLLTEKLTTRKAPSFIFHASGPTLFGNSWSDRTAPLAGCTLGRGPLFWTANLGYSFRGARL